MLALFPSPQTVMDGGGDESPPFTMEDGPAVGGDGGDSPPFTVDSSGGASPPFTVDGNEGGESPPFTADDMDVEEGESPPYTAGMDGESDNTATKAPAPAFPTGAIPKRKKVRQREANKDKTIRPQLTKKIFALAPLVRRRKRSVVPSLPFSPPPCLQ